jgi:hypothetical protein
MQSKRRPGRFQSRHGPASGDGSGTGITGFAPASEYKKLGSRYWSAYWVKVKNPNALSMKREVEEDWT